MRYDVIGMVQWRRVHDHGLGADHQGWQHQRDDALEGRSSCADRMGEPIADHHAVTIGTERLPRP